jgi:hypothetical protein
MQEGQARDAGMPESHAMKEPESQVVQEGQRATQRRKAREPGGAGRPESQVMQECQRARC